MNHSIELHERIGVSDHVRAETEIDAVIYRQEFERHRAEYLKTKTGGELILAFIFLQIYVECFLHQNMRRVVESEFKPPREGVRATWLDGERRHVPDKIENFATLFFSGESSRVRQLVDCIKDRFAKITYIRNLFAHGHKVAAWSDSTGGSGSTPARELLIEARLNQVATEINELGSAWNELLDDIQPQCNALRGVGDFKFSHL